MERPKLRYISEKPLTAFIERLFLAQDVPEGDARLCAEMIVLQEMRGVTTHGLRRLHPSIACLDEGLIKPKVDRLILRDEGAITVIDGNGGIGMPGCMEAMTTAIVKARKFGIGMSVIINNNHFMSAAPYCIRAVEDDMIGICCSNTLANMGYPGAAGCVIGNSPIGFGIPTDADFPIIFDSALTTSTGKLAKWVREGQLIPPMLAGIDKEGQSSLDPKAVLGGTPSPIGGHKGAGLALLIEAISGVLGGGGFLHGVIGPDDRTNKAQGESQCCIAIDISHFMASLLFRQRMVSFIKDLKDNPLAPDSQEILLPGENAYRQMQKCKSAGIPVEQDVFDHMCHWAEILKVPLPADIK